MPTRTHPLSLMRAKNFAPPETVESFIEVLTTETVPLDFIMFHLVPATVDTKEYKVPTPAEELNADVIVVVMLAVNKKVLEIEYEIFNVPMVELPMIVSVPEPVPWKVSVPMVFPVPMFTFLLRESAF